ncbi:MAG: glycosyltransferase [Roseivirga sp.]|nr:glycosyltransferase [Roseivirga sp.]
MTTPADVCAIILTYKNRVDFVNQVVKEALKQGVSRVVIVSNGTDKKVLGQIEADDRVIIVPLEKNTGSGAGYSIGFRKARETQCSYFWLLDDDNLPAPDCLEILLKNLDEHADPDAPHKIALSAYRNDQFKNRKLSIKGNHISLQPAKNSCHGFHIKKVFKLLRDRTFLRKEENAPPQNLNILEANGAFFGGLFLHRDLLDKATLPEDDYFVYADDLDFSHRIIQTGARLLLIRDARIDGLDCSIPIASRKGIFYHSTLDFDQPFRTYYCARNVEHLTRKYFVTNSFVYYLNVVLFILIIGGMALLRGKLGRFRLVLMGLKDSWTDKLGEKTMFSIDSK